MNEEDLKRYNDIGRTLQELVPIFWQKRVFDIALALALLVLFSPLIFLIMGSMALEGLLIRKNSGPFFLTEPRGSEGEVFALPKFRIIRMDVFREIRATQKYQHIKPMESEPENLTRVGAILKAYYLDELPQFMSILIGRMTFVGPRPWPLEPYYDELEEGLLRKKLIRPGLTGLVQANKGIEDGPDEWTLDYAYIGFMHTVKSGWRKFMFDLRVLGRSCRTVLEAKGL